MADVPPTRTGARAERSKKEKQAEEDTDAHCKYSRGPEIDPTGKQCDLRFETLNLSQKYITQSSPADYWYKLDSLLYTNRLVLRVASNVAYLYTTRAIKYIDI